MGLHTKKKINLMFAIAEELDNDLTKVVLKTRYSIPALTQPFNKMYGVMTALNSFKKD